MGGRSTKTEYVTHPDVVKAMAKTAEHLAQLQKCMDRSREQDNVIRQMRDQLAALEQSDRDKDLAVQQLQTECNAIAAEKDRLDKEMKQIKEEEKDPKKLREHEKRLFDTFVKTIHGRNLGGVAEQALMASRKVNVAFVGNVSVGKSTFLNAYFGDRRADVGAGPTTSVAKKLDDSNTLNRNVTMALWDVPGNDEMFHYFEMDKIEFLATMHLVVILYDDTITSVLKIARVATALGKRTLFFRNKLDNCDSEDEKGWQEELENDRKLLAKFDIRPEGLYGISARNTYKAKKAAKSIETGENASGQVPQLEQFQWQRACEHIEIIAEALMPPLELISVDEPNLSVDPEPMVVEEREQELQQ
eukprot:m.224778 g.224778  ORF g.224778 m.224778 type:complete len:360 (-) comp26371_c3_seq2:235-1314(-)